MTTLQKAAQDWVERESITKNVNEAERAFRAGVQFSEQMIPVTEELPSEENGYVEENVLIQDKWGNIAVGVYTYGEYWDSQDERIFANDIVSWRPLNRK